jgi:hypothetical protein
VPTEQIGKFEVKGSDDDIRLIRRTLARCDPEPSPFLKRPVTVEFTRDLPRRGDGGVAWGFSFFSQRRIAINPVVSPYQKKYVFLHEVGHFVDLDTLTRRKRRDLMALMRPEVREAADAPNRAWVGGPYRPMPAECFAEYFVGMVSEIQPVNRAFYQRSIVRSRLRHALEIIRREPADPDPRPDPDPDPDPHDLPDHPPVPDVPGADEVDALRDQLAEALEDLETVRDKLRERNRRLEAAVALLTAPPPEG